MADGAGVGVGVVVVVAVGWGVKVEVGEGEAAGSGVGLGESRGPQAARVMASMKAGRPATSAAETEMRNEMSRFT